MNDTGTGSGPEKPQPRVGRRCAPLRGLYAPAIALGLFGVLGAAIYWANQPYFPWDLTVSQAVQGISWPGVEGLLLGVCLADNDLFQAALLVAGVSLVLATCRAWREAAVLVAVVVTGQALCTLSGHLVGRPRPSTQLIQLRIDPREIEGFPSFPSGHTVHYTVFFGFLGFLAFSRVKPAALSWPLLGILGGLVLLVGPARIYLGAHWVSDVLGGYLLGGSVLAIGVSLYRRWTQSNVYQEFDGA